jgi:hypothetical protein
MPSGNTADNSVNAARAEVAPLDERQTIPSVRQLRTIPSRDCLRTRAHVHGSRGGVVGKRGGVIESKLSRRPRGRQREVRGAQPRLAARGADGGARILTRGGT